MTEATPDQLHAFDRELRQRDPRFVRVLSANFDDGQGEYELRSVTTGQTARQVFTFCREHRRVLTPRFDEETRQRLTAATYAAPDPYAEPLKALRVASSTPASRYEEIYKESRRAEFAATRRRLDGEPPEPRLTTTELADYAPPDPYAAGIKALREKEKR